MPTNLPAARSLVASGSRLRPVAVTWLVVALLVAVLCACKTTPTTKISQIQVVAEQGANQNSATQLDIVFVYDTNSAALLPKTGPDWFSQKATLSANLTTNIDVISLQIPPATLVFPPLPKRATKAVGVYSFANYLSAAGQAVGNLTPYKKTVIWLTPSTILYQEN